jgi:hypothetical protein
VVDECQCNLAGRKVRGQCWLGPIFYPLGPRLALSRPLPS